MESKRALKGKLIAQLEEFTNIIDKTEDLDTINNEWRKVWFNYLAYKYMIKFKNAKKEGE